MSKRKDIVFVVGRAPAPLTCRQISDLVGFPPCGVSRDLCDLIKEGKLVRERSGNSIYHYRLPDPPDAPDLPRIHLQPGPLVPSVGVVLTPAMRRAA